MNYMEDVAQLLGVEIAEKFNIKGCGEYNPYYIDAYGIHNRKHDLSNWMISALLTGEAEIDRKPFKPVMGERYYFVSRNYDNDDLYVYSREFENRSQDYALFKAGNMFRTRGEAITIGIPRYKATVKEYENE